MSHFINKPKSIFFKAHIKHALCLCGNSKKFPLCDGSHKGSDTKPFKFTLLKDEEIILCQCAKSKVLPYCDGSHFR